MDFENKAVEIISSLPAISDSNSRRALCYSAGIDKALEDRIAFEGSVYASVTSMVKEAIDYGELKDGRVAIIAILEAAKRRVGRDRQERIDAIIKMYNG